MWAVQIEQVTLYYKKLIKVGGQAQRKPHILIELYKLGICRCSHKVSLVYIETTVIFIQLGVGLNFILKCCY